METKTKQPDVKKETDVKNETPAAHLARTTELTKQKLEKEPKVSFIIPLVSGEKPGAFEIVNINGYQYTIKKGEMVDIPRSVANVLADHYKITMMAGQDKRIDRDPRVAEALS